MSIILSKEGCVMEIILPLFICFLRSITKFGAVAGLGLLSSVIYASGSDAFEDKTTLNCPWPVFIVRRSSSLSGCAIL